MMTTHAQVTATTSTACRIAAAPILKDMACWFQKGNERSPHQCSRGYILMRKKNSSPEPLISSDKVLKVAKKIFSWAAGPSQKKGVYSHLGPATETK